MKSRTAPVARSLVLSAMLLLATAGIVLAVTIAVDGDSADWGSITPFVTDPQEATVPDNVNFKAGYATSDVSGLYLRYDTFANTRYTGSGMTSPWVYVCLTQQGNLAPGASIPQCNNRTNVHYVLWIQGNNGTPSISLYNCTTGACTLVPGANVAAGYKGTTTTEASVRLSDLGLGTCSAARLFNISFFFDNQAADPDDSMPDTGVTTITVDCPTAVVLSSFTGQAAPAGENPLPVAGMLLAGAVVLAGGIRSRTR